MATPMDLDVPEVQSVRGGSQTTDPVYRQASIVEADSLDSEDNWDWDQQVSSITSSVFDYEYENGRRYHGYKAGVYPLPNDEKELDRLDLQHHISTLALGGELYLAPLQNPRRVLDIGTGTGLWAILMADKHPDTHVLGVDLSPVQPDMVPENAHFEIDDLESPWLYGSHYFDYIHSRIMIGSISDWKKLLKQSIDALKPGGWMELQELDPRVLSDDGTDKNSPFNVEFNQQIIRASTMYNKPVPHAAELKGMLEEAGFVDVEARYYKIPYNTWPRDARLKEIGKYQLINYYEGYEGIGIGLFTRALGWTESEFQVFLAKIRNELRDRSIHTYNTFSVVYGRKPLAPGSSTTSRRASPGSGSSSVVSAHASASQRKILPPVPLFNDPPKTPQPPVPVLPSVAVAAQTQVSDSPAQPSVPAATTPPACPEPPERPSYPGKLTFRINRRGELIRLREGEDPNETSTDKNTVYQFTVNTGQMTQFNENGDAKSGSSGSRKSPKESSPEAHAEHQAKLEQLKRAQEEEARDPEFVPGSNLPDASALGVSPFKLAPGMSPGAGGLYFTKETYAKILAK